MIINIIEHCKRVIVLDVSGIYSQIYDEGYFSEKEIEIIKQKYSDVKHWHILILKN